MPDVNAMKYHWTLNEVASAGRENVDPAHAAQYDKKESADDDAELELLIQRGLSETSDVVDMGAGTGQFTLAAAAISAESLRLMSRRSCWLF